MESGIWMGRRPGAWHGRRRCSRTMSAVSSEPCVFASSQRHAKRSTVCCVTSQVLKKNWNFWSSGFKNRNLRFYSVSVGRARIAAHRTSPPPPAILVPRAGHPHATRRPFSFRARLYPLWICRVLLFILFFLELKPSWAATSPLRPSPAAVHRSLPWEPSQPLLAPSPHLHEPRPSFSRPESALHRRPPWEHRPSSALFHRSASSVPLRPNRPHKWVRGEFLHLPHPFPGPFSLPCVARVAGHHGVLSRWPFI